MRGEGSAGLGSWLLVQGAESTLRQLLLLGGACLTPHLCPLQMVVSAIVDTLKTAFPRSEPQSPTEELSEAETDNKPQTEAKKTAK